MARLASIEKAAWFPSPLPIMDLIAHYIKLNGREQHQGVIFDPCCGEGNAVARLADLLNARHADAEYQHTWQRSHHYYSDDARPEGKWEAVGVELDVERAKAASALLGAENVIQGAFEQITKDKGAEANILFLNPPYDSEGGQRVEVKFIKLAMHYLKSIDLAILILPDHMVGEGKNVAQLVKALSGKVQLHSLAVYKFPEPHYAAFKQHVVFVQKGPHTPATHNLRVLGELGEATLKDLYSNKSNAIEIWRGAANTGFVIAKMSDELPRESVWANGATGPDLTHLLGRPGLDATEMQPLAPLGKPHAAMVAAGGAAGGLRITADNGERLLVRGHVEKRMVEFTETEVALDGREIKVERETQRLVAVLSTLSLDTGGTRTVDSLNSEPDFEDLLMTNAEAFVGAAEEMYPPLLAPEIVEKWRPAISKVCAPSVLKGHKNGLFEAQVVRVAAIREGWRTKQCLTLDGEMSVGKAQPLDAKVLTPTGWKHMGDVTVGDMVVGGNGKPTKVTGVFPQGKKPIYRVTMTDGVTTECTDDHLWTINSPVRINRGYPYHTEPLSAIRNHLAHANGNLQNVVPMVQPMELESDGDRPVDPYLLGLLLGDGGLSRGNTVTFSSVDSEILDSIRELIPKDVTLKFADRCNYRITKSRRGGRPNSLVLALRSLGLMGKRSESKFVPNAYKLASSKVRLAVLQGLADTDGYALNPGASVEYVTVSPQLAEDVMFLVRSLGGRATIRTKETGYQLAYRIFFRLPESMKPFRLTRKAEIYPLSCLRPATHRFKTVEFVGVKEAQCIMVEAKDGLYVTDDFIVTHNTVMSLAAAATYVENVLPKNQNIIVLLPAKDALLRKWEREAKRALRKFEGLKVFPIGIKTYPVGKGKRAKLPIKEIEEAFAYEGGISLILMKSTTAKLGGGGEDTPWAMKGTGISWSYRYEDKPDNEQLADDQAVWQKGNVTRYKNGVLLRQVGEGHWQSGVVNREAVCPACSEPMFDEDFGPKDLGTGRARKCRECGHILWTRTSKSGRPKYPLATYIRDRFHSRYVLIIDEAHESKSAASAISYAATNLTVSSRKMLQMTGTLFGGKASSLFYILHRCSPSFRQVYAHNDVQEFVNAYGLMEKVTKWYPQMKGTSYSGYREVKGRPQEIPGVDPGMVMLLLPHTTFISLDDLDFNMPDYTEHTLFVEPGAELKASVLHFLSAAGSHAATKARDGNHSPMGQYRQARIGTSNIPLEADHVGDVAKQLPKAPEGHVFKKEEALLRLVWDAKQRGRKVMVFTGQIEARDPTPRMLKLLKRFGMSGVAMRANQKKRVEYLEQAVKKHDVVFCSPGLVSTGIDLPMFATGVWFSPNYNMYEVAQANRRFWRLNQELDVEIYYLAYQFFPEAPAFTYIAEKMAGQQALRGDVRSGLARLLGEQTFVSRLQDSVVDIEHMESDMSIDDLPELIEGGKAEMNETTGKPLRVKQLTDEAADDLLAGAAAIVPEMSGVGEAPREKPIARPAYKMQNRESGDEVATGTAGHAGWKAYVVSGRSYLVFDARPPDVTMQKLLEMGWRRSQEQDTVWVHHQPMTGFGWLKGDAAYGLVPEGVLPPLYSTETSYDESDQIVAKVKLFALGSNWTWFLTEYDPETKIAFGLTQGHELELGYISIEELEELKWNGIPSVERDLHWRPQTLGEIRALVDPPAEEEEPDPVTRNFAEIVTKDRSAVLPRKAPAAASKPKAEASKRPVFGKSQSNGKRRAKRVVEAQKSLW